MALHKGILSTPMSPFDETGQISVGFIDEFSSWQKDSGVSGFYILGTWGGFATLSLKERMLIAEAYASACNKYNLSFTLHITANSFADTVILGKHALSLNPNSISVTLPPYYCTANYLSLNEYKLYFDRLCQSLNSPVMLYNNPRTTGVLISPDDFISLIEVGVNAVKDGSKNLAWLIKTKSLLKSNNKSAEIIPGNSVAMLYAFLYGCESITSGASVVYPDIASSIYTLCLNKDFEGAAYKHSLLLSLRQFMNATPSAPSMAYALLNHFDGKPSLGHPPTLWSKPSFTDLESVVQRSLNVISHL